MHPRRNPCDLRAKGGHERHRLPGISHRQPQRGLRHLRRQRERVALSVAARRQRGAAADPRLGLRRPPPRLCTQPDADLRLFTMRDHQLLRQPTDPREGEPLHEPPRRKKSGPGIGCSVGNDQRQRDRDRKRHGCQPGPESVSWLRHRLAEITAARRLRHLTDGRLAERPRRLLVAMRADNLHDAEQLVAQRRKPAGDQPRQTVEPAMAPDPAVEGHGNRSAAGYGRREEHPPHETRRVADAVEQKQHEPGHEHAADRAADGLDRLDRPDNPAEGLQLPTQALGQRKAACGHTGRRQISAHASPHVMVATP